MVSTQILSSTVSVSVSVSNTDIIRNISWAPNQHIKMISEGSCDTEE